MTEEVNEHTGKIDLNNRYQLQLMLDQYTDLLKSRSDWDRSFSNKQE